MKTTFSSKKTGNLICKKIIEYLSKKRKIILEEKGFFYHIDQGMKYPDNYLDYFFVEYFDRKMKRINLILQFYLGDHPDHIDRDGNIRVCLNESVEFSDDKIVVYDGKGKEIWTIKEDTHVQKFGRGSIL